VDFKKTIFSTVGSECFPGLIGVEVIEVTLNKASARLEIKQKHLAPNGYLHAGSIITLADTIAGYGCLYNLPEKATSFTTLELKSNFLGTTKTGFIKADASLQHAGKTTQVWDVTVIYEENQKTIALFRCTQLILY
jgi:uncharacterized protein (TIGR00369 family)